MYPPVVFETYLSIPQKTIDPDFEPKVAPKIQVPANGLMVESFLFGTKESLHQVALLLHMPFLNERNPLNWLHLYPPVSTAAHEPPQICSSLLTILLSLAAHTNSEDPLPEFVL